MPEKNKVLNISNILSVFRILLIYPFAVALLNEENILAFLIGSLAVISDAMDGYFARRFQFSTEIGKVLDPLADKLLMATAAIILLYQGRMPVWFGVFILSRDLILLLGGLYATKLTRKVLSSNILGKTAAFTLSVAVAAMVLGIDLIIVWTMWISFAFLVASLIVYLARAVKIARDAKLEKSNSAD